MTTESYNNELQQITGLTEDIVSLVVLVIVFVGLSYCDD